MKAGANPRIRPDAKAPEKWSPDFMQELVAVLVKHLGGGIRVASYKTVESGPPWLCCCCGKPEAELTVFVAPPGTYFRPDGHNDLSVVLRPLCTECPSDYIPV
jgi:hypothetical protein